MKKFCCIAICVLCCCACEYDRIDTDGGLPAASWQPNMDIGDLTAYHTDGPLRIHDAIVVAGYVTANDLTGNFYRTFVIEDETGAVEIKAGGYHLHNDFQQGRRVVVACRGLTLGRDNGVPQLGLAASAGSHYQTDYMGSRAARHIQADSRFAEPEAAVRRIAELDLRLCGRLVTIRDVRLDNGQGGTWALTAAMTANGNPETGYRQFRDAAGDSINVVTSGYALFAGSALPAPGEPVSLTGILLHGPRGSGKSVYLLKIRRLSDVK